MSTKLGRRQSTYISYIEPILETRKNLKLIIFADVTRIIFNFNKLGKPKRAVGVWFNRHGSSFLAYANKEVILSSGALGTPLLMFKSGLGPAEMLNSAGVNLYLSHNSAS